jgi:hypothetical protein
MKNTKETSAPPSPPPPHIDYDNPSVEFKYELVRIGPEKAEQIIRGSQYNRQISQATVSKYVRDMRAGNWWFNAQPIILNGKLNHDAVLLNGVHRLTAIIAANVTIPFLLVSGIEPRSIKTMDTGRPRNFAQMLDIDGANAPKVLAAMIQLLAAFRLNLAFKGRQSSTLELYQVLAENPGARDIAPEYQRRLPGGIPPGLLACCEYLFAEKDPVMAKTFCDNLVSGENLEKDDPIYVLREWLNRAEKQEKKTRNVGNALVEYWNKFRRGEKITKFRLPKDCPEIE